MGKAIVVYESKYGNTKLVAEAIAEGMNQVLGQEAVVAELNDVDLTQIDRFDTILVGSPNHIGGATRGIRKFIDKLGKLNLEDKQGAVFDTYLAKDFEKAVKKMEKQIGEKVPGLTLVAPGLSIMIDGMKGPITDGELSKCKEFGVKIATQMK
jgi:flavodoxin